MSNRFSSDFPNGITYGMGDPVAMGRRDQAARRAGRSPRAADSKQNSRSNTPAAVVWLVSVGFACSESKAPRAPIRDAVIPENVAPHGALPGGPADTIRGAGASSADAAPGALAGTKRPQIDGAPFTVKPGLFDQTQTDDLGLAAAAGTQTVTIFSPTATTDRFSNGVAMIGFKGYLYAQWQSSAADEDAPDTWVAYGRSQDKKTWSAPMTLAPKWDQGIRTSGGWWTSGGTLIAYINVWPQASSPRGGYTEYTTSTDGMTWTRRKRLTLADGTSLNGIFEQDPRALPEGRIINAAHFQPGLVVAPCYTDDPFGLTGWTRGTFKNLPYQGDHSREMEPSWFWRADGAVVMVFRDQSSTYRRLASVSSDRGQTWTTPVETEMPDSRSKQSAGNLPDGTAFQVGNPVQKKTRFPLVLSLSQTGYSFDRAFVLRRGGDDLQVQRYPGKAKTLGYSYPKSMLWDGFLYVSYATNKEDVEYTRVPLPSLGH